jgi:hypothetical protein
MIIIIIIFTTFFTITNRHNRQHKGKVLGCSRYANGPNLVSRKFPQFLRANVRTTPRLSHVCFLLCAFQTIVPQSSYHPMLRSIYTDVNLSSILTSLLCVCTGIPSVLSSCVSDLLTGILALATILELTFNRDEEGVSQLFALAQKRMMRSENMATQRHVKLQKSVKYTSTWQVRVKSKLQQRFCSL